MVVLMRKDIVVFQAADVEASSISRIVMERQGYCHTLLLVVLVLKTVTLSTDTLWQVLWVHIAF